MVEYENHEVLHLAVTTGYKATLQTKMVKNKPNSNRMS